MSKILSTSFLLPLVFSATVSLAGLSHARDVQFIPESLNYGFTMVDTCKPKRICAVNNTTSDIADPTFSLANQENFNIQKYFQDCPNPLLPGAACIMYVNFCPKFDRAYQDIVVFSGSGKDYNITLKGEGISPTF